MVIKLSRLHLLNFKGIRDMHIDFHPDSTTIMGDNGTGKTTIADAFIWLLTGKNSDYEKNFNIKTLKPDNTPYHGLEHSVEGYFEVDGLRYDIKRLHYEMWVKKRGSEERDFKGHQTDYFFNGVPCNQKEFQKKMDEIIDENLLRLITSPLYFNSLHWEQRRDVLIKMAGEVTNEYVVEKLGGADKTEYIELLSVLNRNKTVSEYRKEINSKKLTIKNELATVPVRISEAKHSLPELLDYDELAMQIASLDRLISDKEKAMEDNTARYQVAVTQQNLKQNELLKLKSQYSQSQIKDAESRDVALRNAEIKLNEASGRKRTLEALIAQDEQAVARYQSLINTLEKQKDEKREKWYKVDAETITFDEKNFCCPTCNTPFEESEIIAKKQELTTNFNNDKVERLSKITEEGQQIAKTQNEHKLSLEDAQIRIRDNQKKLQLVNAEIIDLVDQKTGASNLSVVESEETKRLKGEIDNFVMPEGISIDNSILRAEKQELSIQRDALKTKMLTKSQREKTEARIKELEESETTLSAALAELEKTEFAIEKFVKAKMDTIEERVNHKFKLVQFRMFKPQVNGGIEACCDCMVNGVPYDDVNNANKINAGIDIINALCEHYSVWAPIFIDNRESVNNLLPCSSQLVNLVVTKDPTLIVINQ